MALLQNLTTNLTALGKAVASAVAPSRKAAVSVSGLTTANTRLAVSSGAATVSASSLCSTQKVLSASTSALYGTMKQAIVNTIAWNDEIRRQVRGTIVMNDLSTGSFQERALFLEREARSIQMMVGVNEKEAASMAKTLGATFATVGKELRTGLEKDFVGGGLFGDVVDDLAGNKQRVTDAAQELINASLVASRHTGASIESIGDTVRNAMTRLEFSEGDTVQLLDQMAVAASAYGLNGEKSTQLLTSHLEEIQRQDVKDRLGYTKKLLTTAGMMERAGIDMKKFAGNLHPDVGAKGLTENAMAAALLGTSQADYFNTQQRVKQGDTAAIKSLSSLLTQSLATRAPNFDVEAYRREQSGSLRVGSAEEYARLKAGQEQASVLLNLVGMSIDDYLGVMSAASRTKFIGTEPSSVISQFTKSREILSGYLRDTQTHEEVLTRIKGSILGFLDQTLSGVTKIAAKAGIKVDDTSVRSLARESLGSWDAVQATGVGAAAFALWRKLSAITVMASGSAAGATTATATATTAGTAAAASKVPLAVAAVWIGAGIKTALSSREAQAATIRAAQSETLMQRVVSGVVDPISNVGLLASQVAESFSLKRKDEASQAVLRQAEALALEVNTKLKMSGISPNKSEEREKSVASDKQQVQKQTTDKITELLGQMVFLLQELRDSQQPRLMAL